MHGIVKKPGCLLRTCNPLDYRPTACVIVDARSVEGTEGIALVRTHRGYRRHERHPQFGEYSLPGGGVEPGETLEEAILREMEEELGLENLAVFWLARPLMCMPIAERTEKDRQWNINHGYGGGRFYIVWHGVIPVVKGKLPRLAPCDTHEIQKAKWVTPHEAIKCVQGSSPAHTDLWVGAIRTACYV